MAYISFIAVTFGVIISAVSGTVLFAGGTVISGYLDWIPGAGLLLASPQAALGFGLMLFVIGLVCPPSRIR
ncbi:MAG: hypothetical protein MI923_06840 [Phycisphaerales bacterium]|nr:hypothetical protein [Phycisphaerales bacterium]